MSRPLVSVVLCTRDRRQRVKRAIACYLAQDYPNKEIIVVDDGEDKIADLVSGPLFNGRYLIFPGNLSMKRNAGIRASQGEYICNADDDDWFGPNRISDQVEMFSQRQADIMGYGECYWWDEVRNVASLYKGPLWGATMMYRRDFALAHPWNESVSLAEDGEFMRTATWCDKPAGENMVAVMHEGNWQRTYSDNFWPIVPYEQLPKGFREEMESR